MERNLDSGTDGGRVTHNIVNPRLRSPKERVITRHTNMVTPNGIRTMGEIWDEYRRKVFLASQEQPAPEVIVAERVGSAVLSSAEVVELPPLAEEPAFASLPVGANASSKA